MGARGRDARLFASVVGAGGAGLFVFAVTQASWGAGDSVLAVLLLSSVTLARPLWWAVRPEPTSWHGDEMAVAAAAVLVEPWTAVAAVTVGVSLGNLATIWVGDGSQRLRWDGVKLLFLLGSTALGVAFGVLLAPTADGSVTAVAARAAAAAGAYAVAQGAMTQGVLSRVDGVSWWRAVRRDAVPSALVSSVTVLVGVGVATLVHVYPARLVTAIAVSALYVGLSRVQREAFTAWARLRALLAYTTTAGRHGRREDIEDATLAVGRSLLHRDLRWGDGTDGGFPVTLTDGSTRHLVLSGERNGQPRPFGVDDLRTMELLAGLAETSLENELVRRGMSARVDALSAGSELKSTVLQAVAHDLRSPLQAVLGFSATLRTSRSRLTPEAADHLVDRIHGAGRRMQRVIGTIMAVEELELGAADPHGDTYDATPTLIECLDEVREASSKRVELVLDGDERLPTTFRRELLDRVVTNLVTNAVKHSPEGTVVDVRASSEHDRLTVSVADRGPGVPLAARSAIFSAFTQVGDERSREGGLGLGLYVAARITALAGGRLEVDDRPDGGARFSLAVPSVTNSATTPARQTARLDA